MAKVCKYKCEIEKGQSLKQHWQKEHPEELAKIKKWLGETDAKIVSAKILAEESMKGAKNEGI